jgi:hypothetical protein
MSTLETPDNATLPKPNVSRGELRRQDAKGRPGQAKKDRIMLKKPTPEPKAPHGEAKSHLNDYVEEKPSHPGGRPSSFRPEYVKQAEKLCKLGATDLDLAGFFEVDVSTIWRWATKYPEFRSALKSGKEVADDRVERSLYQRAVGYSHDAVRVLCRPALDRQSTRPTSSMYRRIRQRRSFGSRTAAGKNGATFPATNRLGPMAALFFTRRTFPAYLTMSLPG